MPQLRLITINYWENILHAIKVLKVLIATPQIMQFPQSKAHESHRKNCKEKAQLNHHGLRFQQ
jgi:hypothetical protein